MLQPEVTTGIYSFSREGHNHPNQPACDTEAPDKSDANVPSDPDYSDFLKCVITHTVTKQQEHQSIPNMSIVAVNSNGDKTKPEVSNSNRGRLLQGVWQIKMLVDQLIPEALMSTNWLSWLSNFEDAMDRH